jgi:hypothetical protein
MSIRNLREDPWFCRQWAQALVSGPGGFACLTSVILILAYCGWDWASGKQAQIWVATLFLVLFCVFCIGIDSALLIRNNGLALLRRVADRNRTQLRRINVEFSPLTDFLRSSFAKPRIGDGNEELRLVVEALDRLTRTALRYGVSGRAVFERNLEPISIALTLVRVLPEENPRSFLNSALARWLQEVPIYDPEGWSLLVSCPRQLA